MSSLDQVRRAAAVALLFGRTCLGQSSTPPGPAAAPAAYTFSIYAGRPPHSSADGPAASAQFNNPTGIAADLNGNLFIADTGNDTIRKVTASGIVTTLAGAAGIAGSADGPGGIARFNAPRGIAVDAAGNLYVADTGNDTIRKIAPDGQVTTIAGRVGVQVEADGVGTSAQFLSPACLTIDSAGNLYVNEDAFAMTAFPGYGCSLRKISPDGTVTTLIHQPAGTGVAVDGFGNVYTVVETFGSNQILKLTPSGVVSTTSMPNGRYGPDIPGEYASTVAVDRDGNIFEGDARNGVILKLSPDGVVTTVLSGRNGAGMAVDPTGSGVIYLTTGAIERIDGNGALTVVAGLTGTYGSTDGTGRIAQFNWPSGLAVDRSGTVYVADTNNSEVRKIAPGGIVTTWVPSNGPLRLRSPDGIAVGPDGTAYVADTENHTIDRVTPAGLVSTLAGSPGESGSADGRGSSARFNRPAGIAVDSNGTVYVSDTGNHTIREINDEGDVFTLAGTAGVPGSMDGSRTNALFDQPIGIALDSAGFLYVADELNNTIRKIAPDGTVTTFAGLAGNSGYADGQGTAARFSYPWAIAVDARGNVFVGDLNDSTIREITRDGTVSTIAGLARQPGSSYGTGSSTRLSSVLGLAVDAGGNLYVSDAGNGVILIGAADIPAPGSNLVYSGGGRLANLSSRVQVGTGPAAASSGLVISGAANATKQVLIRAVGPALGQFGLTGALAQPVLSLYDSTGKLIAANSAWGTTPVKGNSAVAAVIQSASSAAMRSVGAFTLPAGSADSALIVTLPPGAYSAAITGAGNTTGLALAEIYELNPGDAAVLSNISTRALAGTGANVLLGGFVVSGSQSAPLLIRGAGPTLASFGVNGVLAQPVLTIFDSAGRIVATNQGWGTNPVAGDSLLSLPYQAATAASMLAAGAFAWPPASADSALLLTVPPGSYSAAVTGAGGTTGAALVEIYRRPNAEN